MNINCIHRYHSLCHDILFYAAILIAYSLIGAFILIIILQLLDVMNVQSLSSALSDKYHPRFMLPSYIASLLSNIFIGYLIARKRVNKEFIYVTIFACIVILVYIISMLVTYCYYQQTYITTYGTITTFRLFGGHLFNIVTMLIGCHVGILKNRKMKIKNNISRSIAHKAVIIQKKRKNKRTKRNDKTTIESSGDC